MSRTNFTERLYKSEDPKTLICQLCSNFYDLGWVTGSGGGMSIKIGDKVFVAPSGSILFYSSLFYSSLFFSILFYSVQFKLFYSYYFYFIYFV